MIVLLYTLEGLFQLLQSVFFIQLYKDLLYAQESVEDVLRDKKTAYEVEAIESFLYL